MSLSIKQRITSNLLNIPGWHTNRKIIVIESDDWGSIRMPSKEVYKSLLNKGIRVDKLSFNRFDSLASEEDLTALFDVLNSVHDKNGNPAIFTANTIVANPDFDKIKESGYNQYFYEPFTETLKRYPNHSKSFDLWKEGMTAKVFHPQFHGREHLNVQRWLKALCENIGNVRLAFENRMYDLSESGVTITENSFMDSMAFNTTAEFDSINSFIADGLNIFEELFGYRSKSFIAPCYIWDSKQEAILSNNGVSFIQGSYFQKSPVPNKINTYKHHFHYIGQVNSSNQTYLTRNCHFEPTEVDADHQLVEDCLNRIDIAFKWGKPAIVSSHRLNYIGYIVKENRDRNLKLLRKLLNNIIHLHPEVEFLSSDQLGDFISNKAL